MIISRLYSLIRFVRCFTNARRGMLRIVAALKAGLFGGDSPNDSFYMHESSLAT
jgi:hypothetical protein